MAGGTELSETESMLCTSNCVWWVKHYWSIYTQIIWLIENLCDLVLRRGRILAILPECLELYIVPTGGWFHTSTHSQTLCGLSIISYCLCTYLRYSYILICIYSFTSLLNFALPFLSCVSRVMVKLFNQWTMATECNNNVHEGLFRSKYNSSGHVGLLCCSFGGYRPKSW